MYILYSVSLCKNYMDPENRIEIELQNIDKPRRLAPNGCKRFQECNIHYIYAFTVYVYKSTLSDVIFFIENICYITSVIFTWHYVVA